MMSSSGFVQTTLHLFNETTISSFSGTVLSVLAMAFRLSTWRSSSQSVNHAAHGVKICVFKGEIVLPERGIATLVVEREVRVGERWYGSCFQRG
jgi:hypothetical protein